MDGSGGDLDRRGEPLGAGLDHASGGYAALSGRAESWAGFVELDCRDDGGGDSDVGDGGVDLCEGHAGAGSDWAVCVLGVCGGADVFLRGGPVWGTAIEYERDCLDGSGCDRGDVGVGRVV